MPERFSGLSTSPTTAAALSAVLGARSFLEVYHDFSDRASLQTVTDEAILIPASGLWDLNHVPDGDVEDKTDLLVNSAVSGGGTDYEPITSGTPSGYQVLVNPTMPWRLEFDVAHAGNTVYATYDTPATVWAASLMSAMWEGLRSAQEHLIGGTGIDRLTVTAGEALTAKRLGYINLDTYKAFLLSDPSNIPQLASLVYIPSAADQDAETTVYLRAKITPDVTPPVGTEILAGNNAQFTWFGDATNPLTSGDYRKVCGTSRDGTTIYFDADLPIGTRMP